MQFILDNLAALLIGLGIMLSLAAISQDRQVATVESGLYYALKQQQLSFIEIVQHDINAATSVTSTSVDPATGAFQFSTRPDPSSDVVRTVAYVRVPVDGSGTAYYRVVRYVDGKESGASAPIVTSWRMELRNGEGEPVASAADGREIAVHLEVAHPTAVAAQALQKSKWEMTFHPPLLYQKTTI